MGEKRNDTKKNLGRSKLHNGGRERRDNINLHKSDGKEYQLGQGEGKNPPGIEEKGRSYPELSGGERMPKIIADENSEPKGTPREKKKIITKRVEGGLSADKFFAKKVKGACWVSRNCS